MLERAAALVPGDALTQSRLARLHDERKDVKKAVEYMSKAVTLDPDQTWMWQYYSELLSQTGREEESALAAEKAKTLGTEPQ